MPRISRYNYNTKKLEWVDATSEEYQAWKAARMASAAANKAKKRSQQAASSSSTDTLEDDAPATPGERPSIPTGPKRAAGGANTRPQSMLAPVLPRIAQSLVVGIMAGTRNLTGGRAPMSPQEATAVAVPALRIADRTAAKYIKKSGKVTPNQEDAALILLTVVVWAVGWIVSSLTNKPRQASQTQQTQPESDDLFAGSEPVGPPSPSAPGMTAAYGRQPAPSPAGATGEPAHSLATTDDDGDLFAGSEPVAPDAPPAGAPMRGPRVSAQQAAANERFLQAVSPTDTGQAMAG